MPDPVNGDHWPWALECDHQRSIDDQIVPIAKNPEDGKYHLTNLNNAQTVFSDTEVAELSVWAFREHVALEWRCPLCYEFHSEDVETADLYND